jgi:RNA polymerase sigma-70 factor (ECF subfamily)
MNDRELLRAWADSGDVDSLGVFLGRYQTSLLRFVRHYLRDDDAAQDIVQETFLRVARSPQRLLDVTSCHNWLLRVARNLSVDHLRSSIRERRHAEASTPCRAAEASQNEHSQPAEFLLARREREIRVRSEIDRLPSRLRELVLLKMQESKSYREIAEITGLSVTNVGYLLHQAMKTLSHRLRDLREDLP